MRVTRRQVLAGAAGLAGGGLVLTWLRPDPRQRPLGSVGSDLQPNAWLQITPDGEIILQIDKVEMGQGITTGFVTLLAEELDVPPGAISPRLAPVHRLFQQPVQITGESNSLASRWLPIRETGARARVMLLDAAARHWDVPRAEVRTDGTGSVEHPGSGRRAGYGALAPLAATLPVPEEVRLRQPDAWRWIGTDVPRPDVPAKVRGSAAYGIDTLLPGLRVALVLRPPAIGARLDTYDATAARSLPGVFAVFPIHTGLAVVGESFWHARRGVEALQARWTRGTLAGVSSDSIRLAQGRELDLQPGHRIRDEGDAGKGLAEAARVLEAEYWVPYLAHAPMEPMNATVWLQDGNCEAWVPTQAPDVARQLLCEQTGLPRARVTVHSTYAGGAFGRRVINDFVAEAGEIARLTAGPVKLVWTREDDMRHGYFREASLQRLRAGLNARGEAVAWEHRLVAASLNRLFFPMLTNLLAPEWLPTGLVSGFSEASVALVDKFTGSFAAREGPAQLRYGIPNLRVDLAEWNPGVPVAIWRSIGHSYTCFAIESFIDELAAAAGIEPAEFRRRHLAAQPRHLKVLELVLERSGWNAPPPDGRHRGLAIQEAFGTVVAQVVEISIGADQAIRVHRVTCAVDCGTAVNPGVVRQQMEGGILFGLSAALFGEITIEDGAVRESNFHDYRLLRLADAPAIDVHIVPSDAPPSGVGEPGVPPIAPAVANAVFAATGQRLRSLPLRLT